MVIHKILKAILIASIRAYQLALSGFLGPCCRFMPSCSEYAKQAIEQHGCIKGLFLSFKRVIRCHPWHAGGDDPVPSRVKPFSSTELK